MKQQFHCFLSTPGAFLFNKKKRRLLTLLSDTQIKCKLKVSQSSPPPPGRGTSAGPPHSPVRNSLGGSTPGAVTHQAAGSGVDGREGEVCAPDLPHGFGLQPVVRGHGAVCPDVGARGGQHQGLQGAAGGGREDLGSQNQDRGLGGWEVR